MQKTTTFRVAATLAAIVSMIAGGGASAADCSAVTAPMPTTSFASPGPSYFNLPDSGIACFAFHAPAGSLQITGMNSIQVLWSGPEGAPFTQTYVEIDQATLRSAGGLTIAPTHIDTLYASTETPHATVTYVAGHTWSWGALAAGDYELTLKMGPQGMPGADYTLGISAVPEPASAAMAGVGLAVLLGAAGRRRSGGVGGVRIACRLPRDGGAWRPIRPHRVRRRRDSTWRLPARGW